MADLTSVRNPAVRQARRLARRREGGRFLVEAPAAVDAAIEVGALVELFVDEAVVAAHTDRLDAARQSGARVRTVAAHVLEALAATHQPQGLVGVAALPDADARRALAAATLAVLAVDVADPGNVGTIVRTADAAGAGAVLVCGATADPFGPKAVRASAGSVLHLPVVPVDWTEAAAAARAAGLALVATHAHGGRAHHAHDWSGPTALVMGSEAHGLPDPVLAACDAVVTVPLLGRAESLNVAAATAAILFEAARQRHAAAGADPPRTAAAGAGPHDPPTARQP